MSDFVNTIDLLGDDVVARQILDGSITEFRDDVVTILGGWMFKKCSNLTDVDMPNVINSLDIYQMSQFEKCTNLLTVNMPRLAVIYQYMFSSCNSLEKLTFPLTTKVSYGGFLMCKLLRIVDLPIVTAIGDRAFENSEALTCLILRNGTVAKADSAGILNGTPIKNGTGYIYVPRALLSDEDATKDYRRATNWSTFASQFRALEDYTVDGTVTGELDESKI